MTTVQETVPSAGAAEEAARGRSGVAVAAVDVANRVVAALVFVAVASIYLITLSPDVSFWDSGEFIATSHALGIPHPPGTPLYVMIGRVFSLFFHGLLGIASPAQAVNLLSALPSALAAVFLYLSVVRVGKKIWNGGDQSTFCLPATVAGLTAALFAAFSYTLWIDSIEAEVYAISGMWAVFTTWFILVWADSEPKDERILVVIAYLLSLNIGVHLATYLAALGILPFAFLHERRFAIPVSFAVVLAMAKDLQFFLLIVALLVLPTLQLALLSPKYKEQYRWTLVLGHAVAITLALLGVEYAKPGLLRSVLVYAAPSIAFLLPWIALPPPKKLHNPFTDLGFLLALVTVLGFSCHLYLPIRSALHPAINEAQPDNWSAFWKVILRDQYKPNSALDRQASAVFQSDHMFWRYFREQWSPAFLTLLGIPGILLHIKREKKTFVLFGLLFLWTSAALILKMNFTDHEVRERDYFFAPGFFYYTIWMGLGLGWLTRLVMNGVKPGRRTAAGLAATAVCVFIAAVPIHHGWESHDRRGNWIAHDYAYNMLAPLAPNAILFTNGDNDTFPLWYIQEVEGFRKDVRLVNLSLLNTPWYGEQLRDEEPKVPMRFTTANLWQLHPMQDPNTGQIYYVKDIVGHDIVAAVRAQGDTRPVYFAVTVDNLLGYEKDLTLEGLVFRLDSKAPRTPADTTIAGSETQEVASDAEPQVVGDVNLAATRRNLEEVFKYRGLLTPDGKLDPAVYRDDNEQKLVTNYAAAWARMALAFRDLGRMDDAIQCLRRAIEIAPNYDPIVGGFGGMLLEAGDIDGAKKFYLDRLKSNPEDVRVYLGLAYAARQAGSVQEAVDWYHQGLSAIPGNRELLAGLFDALYSAKRWDEAENILVQWLKDNPGDQSARSTLEDLRRAKKAAAGDTAGP